MSYIEVSQKISLTKEVTQEDIKQSLLARLRKAFNADSVTDNEDGFSFKGTTGNPLAISKNAAIDVNIVITKNQEKVRILVDGHTDVAKSLTVLYSGLFFLLLMVGLLPGSLETSAETSGALDVLVFLIFGIFIFYDINIKLLEPRALISDVLKTLDTEFG